ncbi:MAG: hypothetical protein M3R00_07160, partial [Pseudomonadota bacterium]|nr:hypothetical protein [Pseudomonadota bacterium]
MQSSGKENVRNDTRISVKPLQITDLSKDIWQHFLTRQFLDVIDIANLILSNAIIRGHISRLVTPELIQSISDLLQTRHHKTFMSKRAKLYTAEVFMAAATILLAASLPINHFQVAFCRKYQEIATKIINEGSFFLNWTNATWQYGQYSKQLDFNSSVINLPIECQPYDLTNIVSNLDTTNGPAGYWFASFGAAAASYCSARAFFSYSINKNPIKKVVTGITTLAAGTLSVGMPFLASFGWPEITATQIACSSAHLYAWLASYRSDAHSFTLKSLSNMTPALPALPAIADISPYWVTGATATAMIAVGFFAATLNNKNDADLKQDPFRELLANL